MQTTKTYHHAHLFVAAIRILDHQKSTPPTIEDVCQLVNFSLERGHFICNQLVEMGQRLSSYIEFRNLAEKLKPESRAYCISDADAVLYRADYKTGEGMVAQHAPEIAKLYLTEFDEIWQAS